MNGSLQIIKEIYYRMESKITAENFSEIWNNILIKSTDSYKIPAEVIHVSESTISTLGNFSASTGKGKSKKTFNVCAIVASALTGKKILKYEAHFPEGKQKVLYFDTEQSSFHCHKVLERINKLAGFPLDSNNDRIEFVMLREFNPIDRRQIIELALVNRPEVGLVIIDGLRDLLFDINSSTEAADVIGLLMRWTSQHNIHIHTVLLSKFAVYIQHSDRFFLCLFACGMSGVSFLPQEFGSTQEKTGTHFPTENVCPLITKNRQVTIRLNPVFICIPDDCF